MKLNSIKLNPDNPRTISDEQFEKLKKSINDFPKMMELRPIIIDSNNVILGGNMRFKALQDLGFKEIPDTWVKEADKLTEEEKREFIIKDNVSGGEWKWDTLANEWDTDKLEEWGLDLPVFDEDKKEQAEIKFSNELDVAFITGVSEYCCVIFIKYDLLKNCGCVNVILYVPSDKCSI